MNTYENQLMNWLQTGFTQSPDRFSEWFSYDKNSFTFFSIVITDYLLIDDGFNIAKDATSNYSDDSLEFIRDKMQKIEMGDQSILPIPRLGDVGNDMEILSQVDSFLNLNAIDLSKCQLWLPGDGAITISMQIDTTPISPPSPNKAISLFGRIRSFFSRRYR